MGKAETTKSDSELVGACLGGDERAWAELIERYSALVYSVPARARLGESDREDVFQGVWSIAVRHLGSLRDVQSMAAWLITTAQRETWRVAKGAATRAGASEGLAEIAWADPQEAGVLEERQRMRRAMAGLDERCRELLVETFREDRPSYGLISERLGVPRGSIGPTRARCLEKLRRLFGGEG